MTARGTDWGLAALLAALVASGVLTLFAGSPSDTWVFAAHDVLGSLIALLVVIKLRRVWPRIVAASRWDRWTIVGVLGAAAALAALGSGWMWANGARTRVVGFSLLSWHDALGAVLAAVIVVHLVLRVKPLRGRDLAHRRQFLIVGGMTAASLAVWRVQRPLQALLGLPGASRRFTGSYEAGSFTGNEFPTTSWVADNPRPLHLGRYRLRVDGLAARPLALTLAELAPTAELVATLDCTGGFYSTQRWRGVPLGHVLELAGAGRRAHHVSIASVTGYRWSFGIHEARRLLLATHLDQEPISHEHGAPIRLVVPDGRGFQWVKWVERITLLESPDYAAPASTVWSSFSAAGRGAVN